MGQPGSPARGGSRTSHPLPVAKERSSTQPERRGDAAMLNKKTANGSILERVHGVSLQTPQEIQHFGTIGRLPNALEASICAASVENLNQVPADTKTLTDMYKKHHWQVSGPTFYQLHLLYDKHFNEQSRMVDAIAERIQSLGGVSIAMAADVAEMTLIPRPPRGREEVPTQLARLLHAHEIVLKEARAMARQAAEAGDDGTNDLLVSEVIRTNELQAWFVSEHLVHTPVVAHEG